MPAWEGKRTLTIITACMQTTGLPTFTCNHVEVTLEEAENGIHIYLVEAQLLEAGFEEPFVHFPESEAPAFLVTALAQQLAVSMTHPCLLAQNPTEESRCRVSSK